MPIRPAGTKGPSRRTIIITDGDERASLAIVRSLGSAGYRCVVTSPKGRSLAGASRYAARDVAVPPPTTSPTLHASAVRELTEEEGAAVLLPVSEPALLSLLPHRGEISATIPFPSLATVEAICDKSRVLQAAIAAGIRVPHQQEIRAPDDVAMLDLPVVLKPHRSVYTAPDGTRAKVGVRWARSEAELKRSLCGYPRAAFPVLAQEVIRGPGIGLFVLMHDGRLVARFSHRRVREKPPSGGVSVLRQSEPIDADLFERSLALLRAFKWSGVAMVECKRDETTGEAVLMEINGRFWGSLQLAIDAGVDFPRLLVASIWGEPAEEIGSYRFVRSRWFWGDVDHLLAVWRDPRATLRSRFMTLIGWLRAVGPGYRSEVFRWTDPQPFVRETVTWIRDLVRR